MRIGVVLLPEHDWQQDRHRWVRAEEYGFDAAWTYDHLAWRALADGTWHATVPTLAAAAVTTSRIRLGTLVTSPNFRHPVPLAKDLMTLDVMSRGRLTVAVGAGAPGYDARVLGGEELSPAARHERFVEFTALLDRLLRQPVTDWSGRWYQVREARMIPGPQQRPRPPLVVAAEGPRTMRLAVSSATCPGDGWVTMGLPGGATVSDEEWWGKVSSSARRMDEAVEERGDEPPGFVRLLNLESRISTTTSVEALRDQLGRARALGFTDVALVWPRPTHPFRGDERILEAVAADLPALRAGDA